MTRLNPPPLNTREVLIDNCDGNQESVRREYEDAIECMFFLVDKKNRKLN